MVASRPLMPACQDDNHLSVENRRRRLSSCLARKIRSQPRRFLFCLDSTADYDPRSHLDESEFVGLLRAEYRQGVGRMAPCLVVSVW